MSKDKLPDAGFIYTGPMYWPHEKPWEPRPGTCRASVHDGGRSVGFHQCSRKVTVEREVSLKGKAVTIGYCRQHDPVEVARRTRERDAKWRAEWDERDRKHKEHQRQRELEAAALTAIREIAAGHNDARGLALELLARFEPEEVT